MSTELATRNTTTGGALSLQDKMKYAEALATANLLPRQYQQNPGNVLLAMELGEALGIPAIQAINDIHVIEGKTSASANLIGAMVRKAGHKLRVTGDDTYATAQITRADDTTFTFEVTWDLGRAKTAGLIPGKPTSNWSKYPAAMLKARAITECARAACPDALYGVIYTPEELGAVVTEAGEPVEAPNPAPARQAPQGGSRIQQARQRAQQQAQAAPAPSAPSAPSPAEAGPEMCTPELWAGLSAALQSAGYESTAAGVEAIQEQVGRALNGPAELTAQEARDLTAFFTQDPTAEPVQGELVDDQEG